jgi:hypothetical protein
MPKKLICLLLCTMVLAGFAGCWQVVHVTDPHGNPIEGVNVTTTYQKGYIGPTGPSATTNSRGNAYLSVASEPYPLWMNYIKKGYFRSADGYTTNLKVNKVLNPIAGAN